MDRKPWLPIVLLASALVLWAGLFAAGAYLNLGSDRPQHDLRKPLIIMATMAGFLSFWGMALWLRGRGAKNQEPGPPAYLRALDPRSVEALKWALSASLMCDCEKCKAELDLPHWGDPPWNGDVEKWAKDWAPKIQELGWSMAEDCFNLLCPKCATDAPFERDPTS